MEALRRKAEIHAPVPATGSLTGDVAEFLSASFGLAATPSIAGLLVVLAAEAQADQAFAERFRAGFVRDRRDALHRILEQHPRVDRRDPDIRDETIVDLVFGIIWYRIMIQPGPLDERTAAEIVSLISG